MSQELYWLTLTALMTGLFWVPYILNRFAELGVITAIMNPQTDPRPQAQWAERMMSAHRNAVENLVVFAPLVVVVQLSELSTAYTAKATMVYFFARLIHYIVYTLGVPGVRTVCFIVGFICQMILGLTAVGVM